MSTLSHQVSDWLERKHLSQCHGGLAMLGVTKLLDLANAPPNEIREALKATAVDAKVCIT